MDFPSLSNKIAFISFQIVLYFPKGSSLRSRFDDRIRYLKEAGLVDKWIEDAMDEGRAKAGFETE